MLIYGKLLDCHYMTTSVFVMTIIISCASSINLRTIHVKENSPRDTIVADVSDFFEDAGEARGGGEFILLNQKLVGQRLKHHDRKRWLALDSESGILVVRKTLDRETMCQALQHCTLHLQIFSKSSSEMVELNVEITDENEFPPTFPVNFVVVNISEGAQVGDVISIDQCRATDRDSSFNSSITYSLDRNDRFGLRQFVDETGSLRLQIELLEKLDFEVKSFHRLTLTANDSGSPSLSSQIPLQVRVIDENDNSPKFKKQEYFVALQENLGAGHVISQIQAQDADSGLSGTINYFISGPNRDVTSSLFEINQQTGEIALRQNLDRETVDDWSGDNAFVSGAGGMRFKSWACPIEDSVANDLPPLQHYLEKRCVACGCNDSEMGPANSVIVFLEARDLGEPQLIGRTRLVIYVSDVNDNAPIITVSFIYPSKGDTVYISESMPKHGYFAYVNAKDFDMESNGQVQINVKATAVSSVSGDGVNRDASDMFRLTKDGFLGLNQELDRENESRYLITINATDRGAKPRWSVESIHVVVLDENDHAPKFPQRFRNISVAESADVGSQLIQIQAFDLDASNPSALAQTEDGAIVASTNGDVTYSLDARAAGTFSIEPRTGVITLVSPLDREHISTWMVTVTATDNGYPSTKQNTCRLLITVNDTNDNYPVFTNPLKDDSTVYATILRDDVITRIQAVDYDEGDNGRVRYLLLSVDQVSQINHVNSSLFLLDAATGDLRLNMSHQNLSNSLGRHVALIQVRDFGFPPMRTERKLNVIVTDELVLPSNGANDEISDNVGNSYVIIMLIVASAVGGFLLLVLLVALLRRKRNQKKKQSKTQTSIDGNKMLSSATKQQQQYSANLSKNGSVEDLTNKKCLDQEIQLMTYDTSSTDVTHLSRNDVVIHHHFQELDAARMLAGSREGSLKRIYVPAGSRVLSPNGGHCQDADSGRGDSDPGLGSPFEQGYIRRNSFGPNCNEQCIQYGHSDHCWMPKRNSAGWRSNSPSNVFENKLHHTTSIHKRYSGGCQEYPSGMKSQLTPMLYPSPGPGNMDLTSIYSKTLPHVLVTPATWAENLNLESGDDSAVACKRAGSSDASTTLTYVTESEVV